MEESPYADKAEAMANPAKASIDLPQYLLRSSADKLEMLLSKAKHRRKAAAHIHGKRLPTSSIPTAFINFASSVTNRPTRKIPNACISGLYAL